MPAQAARTGTCERCGAEAELRAVSLAGRTALLCPECAAAAAAERETNPLKAAVAAFIVRLEDPDSNVRGHAAVMLEKLTGMKFQFRTDAPEHVRLGQAAAWREWFAGAGEAFHAEMDARVAGFGEAAGAPRRARYPSRLLSSSVLSQIVLLFTIALSVAGVFVCAEIVASYRGIFYFENPMLAWGLLLSIYEILCYGPLAFMMRLRERRYLGAFRLYLENREKNPPEE